MHSDSSSSSSMMMLSCTCRVSSAALVSGVEPVSSRGTMLPMSKSVAVKAHRQLWDCADLDTSFTSLKSVYLNSKSNSRRIHLEILFNLA